MKDGPHGDVIASHLEPLDVGIDEDKEPITSCVVVPTDVPPSQPKHSTRKLSDRQRLALDALTECALNCGKPPPASFELPNGLRPVPVSSWREEMLSRGVLDHDAPNPREDFRRVRNSLQTRKLIGVRDELVWRAKPSVAPSHPSHPYRGGCDATRRMLTGKGRRKCDDMRRKVRHAMWAGGVNE